MATIYYQVINKVKDCTDDICWIPIGYIERSGYWRVNVGQRNYKLAHRVAYELRYGPIPLGLVLDHLCRIRWCWNPKHLEAVTQAENVDRGDYSLNGANNRSKTHCLQGHPFDETNTYTNPRRKGRFCKECRRNAVRKYRAAKIW